MQNKSFRGCSYWITWEYLNWPDPDIEDTIKRRADANAAAGVNLVVVFGMHFRWDYLPIINRVHDLLAFTAEQMHSRGIELFDHHSAVLTHRAHNDEQRRDIWKRNRHHLPFYPDPEFVEKMQFNGSFLNSWRMIGVDDAKPIWMPQYTNEQFCMNNPDFREAYIAYVKKLTADVPLDGLMSDDEVYYPEWRACGCEYCREKFQEKYGQDLPPVTDDSFWSNRENGAFRDWIKFRFETSADFLRLVRESLDSRIQLMTCCSCSDAVICNATGMSAEGFAPSSDLLMLEMCGDIVDPQGRWSFRIPTIMLQLGIAREHDLPCLGLGYGHFRDSFNMAWAIDRFLGADVWLSTLSGRLGQPDSVLKEFPDDSEICDECFLWDKEHEDLFRGEVDTDVAVIFSRPTRDYFSRSQKDYNFAYESVCKILFEANITFEVINRIPEFGCKKVLILPRAACISEDDRKRLEAFVENGGVLIAFGPTGLKNDLGGESEHWFEKYQISQKLIRTESGNGWPVDNDVDENWVCDCEGKYKGSDIIPSKWVEVSIGKGKLLWQNNGLEDETDNIELVKNIKLTSTPSVEILEVPKNWYVRIYRDGDRVLIQAIPSQVTAKMHPAICNEFSGGRPIINTISFDKPDPAILKVEVKGAVSSAKLHSIDFHDFKIGEISSDKNGSTVLFDLTDATRFVTAEIV